MCTTNLVLEAGSALLSSVVFFVRRTPLVQIEEFVCNVVRSSYHLTEGLDII